MTDYRGDGPNRTGYDDGAPRRVDVGPSHGTTHTHDHTERRGGGIGRWLLILLALLAILAAIGFATGFFSADVNGRLKAPDVDVSVKGGEVPDVDVDSKKLEVGTKKEVIEVPKVETEKKTVEVPAIGISNGSDDKDGRDRN